MDEFLKHLSNNWLFYSLIFSISWGVYGCNLLTGNPSDKWNKIAGNIFYQFNKNFVCSLVGWICLNILMNKYLNNKLDLNLSDLILFIIMLLGLTGDLQNTIYGFIKSFVMIGDIALGWLARKIEGDQKQIR